MKQKSSPYEVLKVALLLYHQSSAHPSNKSIEEFIPSAVFLLKYAADALDRLERLPAPIHFLRKRRANDSVDPLGGVDALNEDD